MGFVVLSNSHVCQLIFLGWWYAVFSVWISYKSFLTGSRAFRRILVGTNYIPKHENDDQIKQQPFGYGWVSLPWLEDFYELISLWFMSVFFGKFHLKFVMILIPSNCSSQCSSLEVLIPRYPQGFLSWVFPRIGGKKPKLMVKIMENSMNKWMIWGVFPFFLVQHPSVGFFQHSMTRHFRTSELNLCITGEENT